jgi:hypothetical protein
MESNKVIRRQSRNDEKPKKRIYVYVERDVKEQLKEECFKRGRSVSDFVSELISKYYEDRPYLKLDIDADE